MLNINLEDLVKSIDESNITEIEENNTRDVAIIGISAKLPMAENINEFWKNLKTGKNCITDLPKGRKDETDRYFRFKRKETNELKYKKGSYLEKVDEFDCRFFNISPREASLMDPNQRMFLETAFKAVEDSGYGGQKLKGTRTGVYVGFVSDLGYQRFIADVEPASVGASIPGNMAAIIPGRISYVLDLKGPSILIDTACSSSLVAVHTACGAIRSGECDMAIVGSSKMSLLPLEDGNMLGIESKSYMCRAFDDESDGTCMGEGVLAIVLKPMSKALKDKDNIYAVIKGSALNQDGSSAGITAPNALAQADVIELAWKDAGVEPETISCFEAHGTGTKLGDPIEIDGIRRAFSKYTDRKQFCAIGSVKTNLGHLDSAAGMAGLIKAVLSLKNKQIPPSLNFDKPNRNIDFERSPVFVNNRLLDWETEGMPRRCGVSAFGLSGTNCHIILEEAPVINSSKNSSDCVQVFTLSAKSMEAMKSLVENYVSFTKGDTDGTLEDICYTANTGRGHYNQRLAIMAESITELREKLELLNETEIKAFEEKGIYYNEFRISSNSKSDERPGEITEAEFRRITALANEKLDEFKAFTGDVSVLEEICSLYVKGADVAWEDLYGTGSHKRISLPTYPFEKRRCWIEIPDEPFYSMEDNFKPMYVMEGEGSGFKNASRKEAAKSNVKLKGDSSDNYTETEKTVGQIWGEILGFDELDVNDNFYDLGGDSIIAMKIANRASKEFCVKLEVSELLQHQSIREFAGNIPQKHSGEKNDAGRQFEIIPAGKEDSYALSSAQRRLYILSQLEGISTSYNMPSAMMVEGSLDKERFEESFRELVRRHEPFRTSFEFVDGEPVQIIHEQVDFSVDYMEIPEEKLNEAVNSFILPFDLTKPPLLRVKLVKTAQDKHLLFMDMHHIIGDGMSLGILVGEFIRLYQGMKLPELNIQYKDYSLWHNKLLEEGKIQEHKAYWTDVLENSLPALNMPLDYKRTRNRTFDGAKVRFEISREYKEKADKLAKARGVTLNTFIFSVYSLLISKFSGQSDVVVGTTVTGRDHADVDNMIGIFINFLPIRIGIDGEDRFTEFMDNVKSNIYSAYEHQSYPFEMMVENVGAKQDPSRNPIFDTMLIFHNENQFITTDNISIGDVKFSNYDLSFDTSTLDIKMDAYPTSDGRLGCMVEYNTNLFKEDTIKQIARHFEELMGKVLENPDNKLKDIDLFTADEKLELEEKRKLNLAEIPLELAVSATFTAEPVEDYIKWWCKKFDTPMDVKFAPYNQVFQELLNPAGMISQNKGVNLLMVRFEDWIRHDGSNEAKKIEKLEKNFNDLIDILKNKPKSVPYFLCCFPVSTHLMLEDSVVGCLQQLNTRWKSIIEEMENVYPVDFTGLADLYNIEEIFDAVNDENGHIPFSDQYYAAMGTIIARKVLSLKEQPFKVVALDCDNTLWKGICGEEGANGVKVEGGYLELQKFMLKKCSEGMLLVLCSKNNETDVWEVFENNPQMLLKREHIAGFRINWQPKSRNIKELADELNLGVDSFIFLDDSWTECSEVTANCPDVLTLRLPDHESQIAAFLQHVWAFDKLKSTEEDKNRTKMYLAEKRRKESQKDDISMDHFLRSLELRVSINNVEKGSIARAAQLTQRTNQFNLSTIRRTEQEMETLLEQPGVSCCGVEVSDRFGDYGLVGVLITRESGQRMLIDSFLLSCRVLGRNVEDAMLSHLGNYCREKGIGQLEARYCPTAKNRPILEFIERTGWQRLEETARYTVFVMDVDKIPQKIEHIEFYCSEEIKNGETEKLIEKEISLAAYEAAAVSDTKNAWEISMENVGSQKNARYLIPLANYSGQKLLQLPVFETSDMEFFKVEYEAPGSEIEAELCEILKSILGVERIGVNDSFFALGGDSIKAMRLAGRIHKSFDVEIPVNVVFSSTTIRELGKKIENANKNRHYSIRPVGEKEYYPVTSAQRRVFFLNRLEGDSVTYNEPYAAVIEGNLHRERLERVFSQLVKRHESLRTFFELAEDLPVQKIQKDLEFKISYVEDTNSNTDHIIKEFIKPFDIGRAPLIRVCLVKQGENRHILICDMHHIISDQVSVEILIKEFLALYNGFKLPELKVQYKDFSIWQSENFSDGILKKQEEYWLERFSGKIPLLNMPTDCPRPVQRSFDGDTWVFEAERTLAEGLNSLAKETGSTLFMVLISAYNILLSKYTGMEDIVIGSPIAGRQHADLENVIGMFVNTLALRNYPKGSKAFHEFLTEVKENSLKDYENQDYPLEELVDKLGIPRDLSRNPLFDTVFSFHRVSISNTQVEDLKFIPYRMENKTSKFDFTLHIEEGPERLGFNFEYCTALYKKETMERLGRDYIKILETISSDKNIKINEIKLERNYSKSEKAIKEEISFDF